MVNLVIIVGCNYRSDLSAFKSTDVVNEQKECRKRSRRTNDLFYIDRAMIREVKSRKKNFAMTWINHKKASDMVPHSEIK